jgi:stearoyl-CoA desaturase (delta-9 desaturase)
MTATTAHSKEHLDHHHEHAHGHARPIPCAPGEIRWSARRSLWLLAMIVVVAAFGIETFSITAFAIFTLTSVITLCVGHSVGLHRGVIHRSYRTSLFLERALVYLATLTGMGGPLALVRMHELRDYWQNQPEAPEYYSYAHGIWRDFLWYLHYDHHPRTGEELTLDLPEEVMRDRFYQFLDRTWMLQQLPIALMFYALAGWGGVVWGICARVAVSSLGHWLVNYVAHTTGYQGWSIEGSGEQGRNSILFGAISMGEGWHNNHHAWPNSARMGLEWWEVDFGYATLWVMEKLGLVWDVQVAGEVAPVRAIERVD